MKKANLHALRPYGDHLDDGVMQITFTLPVTPSDEAREAARLYLEKLGLEAVRIDHMEMIGEGFAFFIAHGRCHKTIDMTRIVVVRPQYPPLEFAEMVRQVRERLGRRIVVVGGTPGSDAHTVGIDAILSMKGIQGDKGLEIYPCFQVHNLRAQVSEERLVEQVISLKADALLVSQLVTQQDQHLRTLRSLVKLLKNNPKVSPHLLKIVGGPRMDHRTALAVGFDGGFGAGTRPSEVAAFIVHELTGRLHGKPDSGKEKGEGGVEGHTPRPAPQKRRSLFGWLSGGGKDS